MSNSFEINEYHVTDENTLSYSNTKWGWLWKVKLIT